MNEELYTVETVSRMLELHSRTVRRYIREGKLPAKKIGKEWRIPKAGVEALVGIDPPGPTASLHDSPARSEDRPEIRASTVVDFPASNEDEAWRVSSSVLAAMNCKGPEFGAVQYEYFFQKSDNTARFLFWGDPAFIGNMLILLAKIGANRSPC